MIDAKALWRGHTKEEREAMALALRVETWGNPIDGGELLYVAAAERLAAPVVVEPKFDRPRKCWLVEYPPDSEWYAWGHEPDETELSDHATVTEALLIPADAVVLTLEKADQMLRLIAAGSFSAMWARELRESVRQTLAAAIARAEGVGR